MPSTALMTAVATLTDAESPSTPLYVPMNWICTSMFLISRPVNFFTMALTFVMDSLAISFKRPVAMMLPDALCEGAIAAMMGRT